MQTIKKFQIGSIKSAQPPSEKIQLTQTIHYQYHFHFYQHDHKSTPTKNCTYINVMQASRLIHVHPTTNKALPKPWVATPRGKKPPHRYRTPMKSELDTDNELNWNNANRALSSIGHYLYADSRRIGAEYPVWPLRNRSGFTVCMRPLRMLFEVLFLIVFSQSRYRNLRESMEKCRVNRSISPDVRKVWKFVVLIFYWVNRKMVFLWCLNFCEIRYDYLL